MKKFWLFYLLLFFLFGILHQSVSAENIHFNNFIYTLNDSSFTGKDKVVENLYYKDNESVKFWTSLIGVFYYPQESNPLKFAQDKDNEIEANETCVLLKFVQNKKKDIAVISYLENGANNEQTFFIYNIYKYEKHPKKGMMVLRFAKKYVFNSKDEINKIAQDVKSINNDLMEQIIISPIPPVVQPK